MAGAGHRRAFVTIATAASGRVEGQSLAGGVARPRAAAGGGVRAASAVRRCSYACLVAKRPSRIDLLELDIDLRLADLWREAAEIGEWNLEVVAAFMRAAYGKGYCDALTEDSPGSLCEEHGYRVPPRRPAPARER